METLTRIRIKIMLLTGAIIANHSAALHAKPVTISIDPADNIYSSYQDGQQIIVSEQPSSVVSFTNPGIIEKNRIQIVFLFTNNGNSSINIGPENIYSTIISVVTYDVLMSEQRRREGTESFFAALSALDNTLKSSKSGYIYNRQTFSGQIDCGIRCDANFNGSSSGYSYSPYLAQQGRLAAQAENEYLLSEMRTRQAAGREVISLNLRTTTLYPNQSIGRIITFDIPKPVRSTKFKEPFAFTIVVGGDRHIFRGVIGPSTAPLRAAVSNPANENNQMASLNASEPHSAVGQLNIYPPFSGKKLSPCHMLTLENKNCSDHAKRLDFAYNSSLTSTHERDAILHFVYANKANSEIDWQKAANEYFTWRKKYKDIGIVIERDAQNQSEDQMALPNTQPTIATQTITSYPPYRGVTTSPCLLEIQRNTSCGPEAKRLDFAYNSSATSSYEKNAMLNIISEHTIEGVTNWKDAANKYFKWRANYKNNLQ